MGSNEEDILMRGHLVTDYPASRRIALALAMLVVTAGCGLNQKSDAPRAALAFVSSPFVSTAINGRFYWGGVLMVSHATGSISVCWKTCQVIGKTEPSGPQDLELSPGGNFKVYVSNLATGHVVACDIETDDFADNFKNGRCSDAGTATR
jgi:hypothetical protein